MSKVGEIQPDPNIIGHIAKPPFVQLPDPLRIFTKRTERLRSLVAGHDLAAYLYFLAGLTDAQLRVLPQLPEPEMPALEVLARAKEHAMPPLDRGGFKVGAGFEASGGQAWWTGTDVQTPAAAA